MIHSHLYLQRAPILLISVGISIHVHVLPFKHIIKNKINVKNLGSGVDSLPIRGIKLIRDAHRAEDAAKGVATLVMIWEKLSSLDDRAVVE